MKKYYISWWNLENLFDVQESSERPEWLQKELEKELEGWSQEILDRKINKLASIIKKMNHEDGPDVIGVCEVENRRVLTMLRDRIDISGRQYRIAHHETSDKRGIDVAFIYDSSIVTAGDQFFYVVLKRTATRDLFQVNFNTRSGRPLILIGNHWPSRRGGVLHSEPYRIIAAETLSYWLTRIIEIKGEDVGVVILGDFNDEPANRSITDYALATNSPAKVLNSRIPRLLNMMWPFYGKSLGTHYFQNFPNILDQVMVVKGILNARSGFCISGYSDGCPEVAIEMMEEMISGGKYPEPVRFGRPASSMNKDGYSDHYPVSMVLKES